ncbi:YfaZ family outer membrane protein [Kaarinaea lacus]
MLVRILLAGILLVVSIGAHAAKMDVNLSQDSARFTYYSLVGGSNFGRTEMSGSLMYNDEKNMLVGLGIQVIDVAGSDTPGLEIGVGPRVYYFTSDDPDASGLVIAVGGDFRYKLAQMPRVVFSGNIHYAPSITSTIDADSYMEFGLRAGYELLPTADIYLGIRSVRVDYTKGIGDHKLDDTAMVGMTFSF